MYSFRVVSKEYLCSKALRDILGHWKNLIDCVLMSLHNTILNPRISLSYDSHNFIAVMKDCSGSKQLHHWSVLV